VPCQPRRYRTIVAASPARGRQIRHSDCDATRKVHHWASLKAFLIPIADPDKIIAECACESDS